MTGDTCDRCTYYRPASADTLNQTPVSAGEVGECHRWPPALNQHPGRPNYRWPVTKPADWCGEFDPSDAP